MTSGPHIHTATKALRPSGAFARRQLRLRLKPKAPPTGYVDGGWWPRSRDLAAELPALAEVLSIRLGAVTRVRFALAAWSISPFQIQIGEHVIRLEASRSLYENVVHVSGSGREPIRLLVVPPESPDPASHNALILASHRGNADRPADILASSGVPAQPPGSATRPTRAGRQAGGPEPTTPVNTRTPAADGDGGASAFR
ncbi:MAG TPA: DUF5994 family protein [Actinocrinis sp.]